jgi:hypothetical protein
MKANNLEYMALTESGDAALFLSQLSYWFQPSASGKSKLSVKHDGHMWVAKTREQWYAETGLTRRRLDSAFRTLTERGLMEAGVWKFKGVPTLHVRLLVGTYAERLETIRTQDVQMEMYKTYKSYNR